jgi:hypothetical protein
MPYVTPVRRAELCKRLTGLITVLQTECPPPGPTPEILADVISSLTTGVPYESLPIQVKHATDELSVLVVALGNAVGDYNYLVTSLLDEFIIGGTISYTKVNMAVGIMDFVSFENFPVVAFMDNVEDTMAIKGIYRCVQLELYRRLAAPYEDIKAEENGDVYRTRT